jgi:hypothetical protein
MSSPSPPPVKYDAEDRMITSPSTSSIRTGET